MKHYELALKKANEFDDKKAKITKNSPSPRRLHKIWLGENQSSKAETINCLPHQRPLLISYANLGFSPLCLMGREDKETLETGANAAFTNVGTATGQTDETWCVGGNDTNTMHMAFNFGQQPFAYTPPTGFLPITTQNLPEPPIKDPSTDLNTKH